MTLILLHKPVPATPADADPALAQRRFERVHMFPGRALGEDEFDREQEYADLRLASLLRGRPAGIVRGLEVNLGPAGVDATSFSVSAGLALDGRGRALSLYYPLRVDWQDLISNWRTTNALADASGTDKYPHLAGQHAAYTYQQLKRFASSERENDRGLVMQSLAMRMSEQEMKAVSEYIMGMK